LLAKRDEIALPASWAWVEKLDLSCPPVQLDNVHDDLKREAAFYERTLAAVKQGLIQLRHAGVPYQRPADFFAEMIKPDSQMAKIKDALIADKKRMEIAEERRRNKEMKKYAKQLQILKQQEKQRQKKQALEELKRLKKKAKNTESLGTGASSVDVDKVLAEASKEEKKQQQQQQAGSKKAGVGQKKVSKKRAAKNAKYGFGGPKRLLKKNTAESAADDSGFRRGKNKANFPGFKDEKPTMKGAGSKKSGKGGKPKKKKHKTK